MMSWRSSSGSFENGGWFEPITQLASLVPDLERFSTCLGPLVLCNILRANNRVILQRSLAHGTGRVVNQSLPLVALELRAIDVSWSWRQFTG